jgi:hypothetical protein
MEKWFQGTGLVLVSYLLLRYLGRPLDFGAMTRLCPLVPALYGGHGRLQPGRFGPVPDEVHVQGHLGAEGSEVGFHTNKQPLRAQECAARYLRPMCIYSQVIKRQQPTGSRSALFL